jgi:hypothetical protein
VFRFQRGKGFLVKNKREKITENLVLKIAPFLY